LFDHSTFAIMRAVMNKPGALLLAGIIIGLAAQVRAQEGLGPPRLAVPYGANAAVGKVAVANEIKLYYESYGSGPVMLQIHGNGQSIAAMGNQIEFFARHYQVLAADSRGHGKSEAGGGTLTYEIMGEDLNALLDQLKLKSVYVLGWSDGGIIGLLLAIHHPDKVAKLAIMGANLEPAGAQDWAANWVARQSQLADKMIASGDRSQAWRGQKKYLDLLGKQPHITLSELHKIAAPTLVMASDKDVIRNEHTLQIFEGIPQAHLCIFPGSTHMIPWQNPALFNKTIETFFARPYTRPDTKEIFK
jgi:pimeloyl-ACP methyl ester carboxylesterase